MGWRSRTTGGVITSLYTGTSPSFPCCRREQEMCAALPQWVLALFPSSKSGLSVLGAGTNPRSCPSFLLVHRRCGLPCHVAFWLPDRRTPAVRRGQFPAIRNQEAGDDISAMQSLLRKACALEVHIAGVDCAMQDPAVWKS